MKITFLLLLGICFWATCLNLCASRAFPRRFKVVQADGSRLTLCRFGDERYHGMCTSDGILVQEDSLCRWCYAQLSSEGIVPSETLAHDVADRSLVESLLANDFRDLVRRYMERNVFQKGSFASNSAATIKAFGKPEIPVVLVQFSDVRFLPECDSVFFDAHLNASAYQDEGGYGSARDYFIDQSDSIFQPHFRILGKVSLSKTMASYGRNSGGNDIYDYGMMTEALDSVKTWNPDLSPYASGSRIPAICFIYAGRGEQIDGPDESIWAKCFMDKNYLMNGFTIESMMCVNERADYDESGIDQPDGIGTFIHEFSHLMGLPDFYATNGLTGNFGLDYWDIMDWGQYIEHSQRPVGYSAYERMFMGWLQPKVLEVKKQRVELSPLAGREGVRSIKIPNAANANEYLMLENRTASKWFSSYYGEGMMVYHVDYSSSSWINNTVNNISSHQRMSVLCADNNPVPAWEMVGGKIVYATREDYMGDMYPGYTNNTVISNTSQPAATAFRGGYFNRTLTEITRKDNGNITFVYMDDGIEGVRPVTLDNRNQIVEVFNPQGILLGECLTGDVRSLYGKGIYIVRPKGQARTWKIIISK